MCPRPARPCQGLCTWLQELSHQGLCLLHACSSACSGALFPLPESSLHLCCLLAEPSLFTGHWSREGEGGKSNGNCPQNRPRALLSSEVQTGALTLRVAFPLDDFQHAVHPAASGAPGGRRLHPEGKPCVPAGRVSLTRRKGSLRGVFISEGARPGATEKVRPRNGL
jgi:hypothetical protein